MDGSVFSMAWVQVSVQGVVGGLAHAVIHRGWEECGSGTCVDVAVEVFEHEVRELEDAEDVAWDRNLELLEDDVGEGDNDLVYCVKL